MFGFGQGKILDRALAARENARKGDQAFRHLLTRTASSTRKVVYLSQVPRRFLDKFETFWKGLYVRRAWVRMGRTGYTLEELVAVGHTMARIDMVVFVCVLVTLTEQDIRPMALQTQALHTLPWVRWRSTGRVAERLQDREQELQAFKATLTIFVLIAPYVHLAD